jgi:hypothetical protein
LGEKEADFLAAVNDLTDAHCKQLDAEMPTPEGVLCQSIGSVLSSASSGIFPLSLSYHLVNYFSGENDGLVSEDSFAWGEKYTLLRASGKKGISHSDIIDLTRENIPEFDVREFYVKLEEEKDAKDSRMFAGYQIQPKKTIAALRGRRWVADYDEGLQKVFFKQNISATIYALADWFSPADTECPTLEYVSFYDRKTYRQKNLSEIPDILYSEVMRDVDLAVSVAHVGGVDPETSHSTIEMRRVIFAFNMELFGLTNVTFEGTHAYIKGTMGNYNVQLGSGVIHKESGGMVNIVPVHSQQRGKIFLPFLDEDPKTAEILAKILLLAEDNKIKDPYILQQLR